MAITDKQIHKALERTALNCPGCGVSVQLVGQVRVIGEGDLAVMRRLARAGLLSLMTTEADIDAVIQERERGNPPEGPWDEYEEEIGVRRG